MPPSIHSSPLFLLRPILLKKTEGTSNSRSEGRNHHGIFLLLHFPQKIIILILEVVLKKCPLCKWRIMFPRCQSVRPEQACEKWEEKEKYPAALSSPSLSTPLITTTEEGMGGERERALEEEKEEGGRNERSKERPSSFSSSQPAVESSY